MFPAERSEVKLRYGNRVTEQFSLEKTCPTRSSVLHSAGKAWKFLDPKTDGFPDIFVYIGGFIFLNFLSLLGGNDPIWQKNIQLGWNHHPSYLCCIFTVSHIACMDSQSSLRPGPDIALELAWKSRNMDFAMPYLIQVERLGGWQLILFCYRM